MSHFQIKKGSTLPSLGATLTSGAAFDLSTATEFKFAFRPYGTTGEMIERDAVVVDAPTKEVRYDFQVEDTDTIGYFEAEFRATFPSGTMYFPEGGFIMFEVTDTVE